jgi:hypothetical protein
MKRHERPYGCTSLNCTKQFGSKADWKRHETKQHENFGYWCCNHSESQGATCSKFFDSRHNLEKHVKVDHSITSEPEMNDCYREDKFWCGFCKKLLEMEPQGLDLQTTRFNHIDDHFMGRHDFKKQSIAEWTHVGGRNSRSIAGRTHPAEIDETTRGSPIDKHSGSSKNTITHDKRQDRKRSADDEGQSPRKSRKTAELSCICCVSDAKHTLLGPCILILR